MIHKLTHPSWTLAPTCRNMGVSCLQQLAHCSRAWQQHPLFTAVKVKEHVGSEEEEKEGVKLDGQKQTWRYDNILCPGGKGEEQKSQQGRRMSDGQTPCVSEAEATICHPAQMRITRLHRRRRGEERSPWRGTRNYRLAVKQRWKWCDKKVAECNSLVTSNVCPLLTIPSIHWALPDLQQNVCCREDYVFL